MQPVKITVVGAGNWGTVMSCLLAAPTGHGSFATEVTLVARSAVRAADIKAHGANRRYLPGLSLPQGLQVSSDMSSVEGADLVVLAVPSLWARSALVDLAPFARPGVVLLSLVKGLEPGSLNTASQMAAQEVPHAITAVLSGPNLAGEVALGLPTGTVVASSHPATALWLQELLSSSRLRVYTHEDVTGCEVAGAVKNVLALGAGMADGLCAGDNARAALVTRGLAEMSRLGVAMGGHPLTFTGLSGLGDLVLTCTSGRSRNRSVGLALGQGKGLEDALAGSGQVAEGVACAPSVVALADRCGVEVPICAQVALVVAGRCRPQEAMEALLGRGTTHELAGAPSWPLQAP